MAMKKVDPYFNDIPWEIIYDDSGRAIGEIYLVPLKDRLPVKFKRKNRRNVK